MKRGSGSIKDYFSLSLKKSKNTESECEGSGSQDKVCDTPETFSEEPVQGGSKSSVEGNVVESQKNIVATQHKFNEYNELYSDSDSYSNITESDISDTDRSETNNSVSSLASTSDNKFASSVKPPGPPDISQNILDGPKQLKLNLYPKRKFGDRWRHFSYFWFEMYKWLEYSAAEDAAFCFPCRFFLKHIDTDSDVVFVTVGFKNWKKALDSKAGFKKHDISADHKSCQVLWNSYLNLKTSATGDKISVAAHLSEAHVKMITENRLYIQSVSKILLFLATQGIAQRGDFENSESLNRGNFLELLALIAENNETVKNKIKHLPGNAKYTSPQIQNEILLIISEMILDRISGELKNSLCYALIVDESKDISKTEQLSVVVRYYLDGRIYERFLGYHPAKKLNAASLLEYIKLRLSKCAVDITKCVAQTYDGANVMSGHLNGVQALFKKEVPQAVYIHCYNHRLNLVIVDVCKKIPEGKGFFDLLETLYIFVSGSSIHSIFKEIQQQLNPKQEPIELKRICYTRWSAQVYACIAMKKALAAILILLHKLNSEKHDRAAEANGLLYQLDFSFIFLLVMYSKILDYFKHATDYLQSSNLDVTEGMTLIHSLQTTFQSMRETNRNSEFNEIFDETLKICEENNIDSSETQTKKRPRKLPQKYHMFITEQNVAEREVITKNDFRIKIFLPTLDIIITELRCRFEQNSTVLIAISCLNPKSKSFLCFEKIKSLALHYNVDVDILQSELKILPNTLKAYESQNQCIIDSLIKLTELLDTYKLAFVQMHKLCVIALTIPLSSAACERTFSCMRRLKTYLRNKMTNDRLCHLAVISIEKKIAKDLDMEEVVNRFSSAHNNRRITLK